MAIKTTLAQIEEVQAAITEVMTSQELDQGGQAGKVVRARLKELTDYEEKLLARYAREQGTGGPAINVGVPNRSY